MPTSLKREKPKSNFYYKTANYKRFSKNILFQEMKISKLSIKRGNKWIN